jgi:hypothetical protein
VVIVLNQYTAFPTIESAGRSKAPDLLVPEPAAFSSLLVLHPLHQTGISTADAREGGERENDHRIINRENPQG